jgi:hypothetical protein
MDNGIMCYAHIITDLNRGFFIGAMDSDPVLYIHIISDMYVGNIATYNGIEPYAAIIAHDHFPAKGCIVGQETAFTNPW